MHRSLQSKACDQGGLCSGNETYRLCVQDVNNNGPQFVFPNADGTTVVEVLENSTVGDIVRYNGSNLLIFSATDKDESENGRVSYTWKGKMKIHEHLSSSQNERTELLSTHDDSHLVTHKEENSVFKLDSSSGIVTLQETLNREVASFYTVSANQVNYCE